MRAAKQKPQAEACATGQLDMDGAFEDADGGAADARDQEFGGLRDFDFDLAGATHVFALHAVERVGGGELFVADEIGSERAGGAASGGVFVEFPGEHAAGVDAVVSFEREAVGHGAVFAEKFAEIAHVHFDFGKGGAVFQRDH